MKLEMRMHTTSKEIRNEYSNHIHKLLGNTSTLLKQLQLLYMLGIGKAYSKFPNIWVFSIQSLVGNWKLKLFLYIYKLHMTMYLCIHIVYTNLNAFSGSTVRFHFWRANNITIRAWHWKLCGQKPNLQCTVWVYKKEIYP
jgi:hypothetical protein